MFLGNTKYQKRIIMRRIIISILIVVAALLLIFCSDPSTSPSTEQNLIEHEPLYKPCCNNMFPSSTDSPTGVHSFTCSIHGYEETTAFNCANVWSYQAISPTENQITSGCVELLIDKPKTPASLSATRNGSYVSLSWGFVYAHKYVLERKVGLLGSWSTRATINNCLTEANCGSNSYSDYVGTSEDIFYRVRSRNFSTNSNASQTAFVN